MTHISQSEADTRDIAKKLAENAKPNEVYALYGDLGVGKTAFAQGFAEGLKVTEPVCSPTFTIVQEYRDGRLPFYHFDVYRIGDSRELLEIGFDDYIYNDAVSLIEWANIIEDILPPDSIRVTIEKDLDKGFDFRKITVEES